MLSILIPARNEKFLSKTVEDLLKNAQGDIEVIVCLDGWDFKDEVRDKQTGRMVAVPRSKDPRVIYIEKHPGEGMRAGINSAAAIAKGRWLMKIDGHCMVSPGFDVELTKNWEKNTVVIPRRKRLDADNWCIQDVGKVDIDYEYLCFPNDPSDFGGASLHGRKWDDRSRERLGKPEFMLDENMSFQGSCWVMEKEYFEFLDLMDEKNYGVFTNEAQEIGLKCWLSGGRVLTNKNVWYAHLHKGKTHGRGYRLDERQLIKGGTFTRKWLDNSTGWKKQTLPFSFIIERFWPVPAWPEDWKEHFPGIDVLPTQ